MRYAALPSTPAQQELRLNRIAGAAARGLAALSLASIGLVPSVLAQSAGTYKVTNIISDGSVPATTMDANFIDPWGMSTSPNWWISAAGTGFNYVAQATGTIPFKVIVPAASGLTTATGQPTGSVTTAGVATGMILPDGLKASFIFSTLDGTISGWNSKLGTANAIAQIVVNNSSAGAVYTGLALVNNSSGSFLLAPNFGAGKTVEIYDNTFKAAKLTGSFTDPTLPATYAPYAIHVIGTQVFVTYAVRSTTSQEVLAPGNGIVSVFDTSGTFVSRVVTGGNLNAPWGVAIAPANFGIFSNDLLIGNFGDGKINVYDPKTFAFLGQMADGTGKPLVYASLWDLLPGGTTVAGTTAVSSGDTSTVYFSSGLANETHGLVAGISNNPTATGTPTFGFSSSASSLSLVAGSSASVIASVAPTNNFTGTVTLACSGLPLASFCTFSPAQLTTTGTAPAITTITIQTAKNTALLHPLRLPTHGSEVLLALLLPFGSMLAFASRRSDFRDRLRLFGLLGVLFASLVTISGCSNDGTPSFTPAGTSQVTITATSGAITQSTVVSLQVQ